LAERAALVQHAKTAMVHVAQADANRDDAARQLHSIEARAQQFYEAFVAERSQRVQQEHTVAALQAEVARLEGDVAQVHSVASRKEQELMATTARIQAATRSAEKERIRREKVQSDAASMKKTLTMIRGGTSASASPAGRAGTVALGNTMRSGSSTLRGLGSSYPSLR
jgi:chromosome segregation ATPase